MSGLKKEPVEANVLIGNIIAKFGKGGELLQFPDFIKHTLWLYKAASPVLGSGRGSTRLQSTFNTLKQAIEKYEKAVSSDSKANIAQDIYKILASELNKSVRHNFFSKAVRVFRFAIIAMASRFGVEVQNELLSPYYDEALGNVYFAMFLKRQVYSRALSNEHLDAIEKRFDAYRGRHNGGDAFTHIKSKIRRAHDGIHVLNALSITNVSGHSPFSARKVSFFVDDRMRRELWEIADLPQLSSLSATGALKAFLSNKGGVSRRLLRLPTQAELRKRAGAGAGAGASAEAVSVASRVVLPAGAETSRDSDAAAVAEPRKTPVAGIDAMPTAPSAEAVLLAYPGEVPAVPVDEDPRAVSPGVEIGPVDSSASGYESDPVSLESLPPMFPQAASAPAVRVPVSSEVDGSDPVQISDADAVGARASEASAASSLDSGLDPEQASEVDAVEAPALAASAGAGGPVASSPSNVNHTALAFRQRIEAEALAAREAADNVLEHRVPA